MTKLFETYKKHTAIFILSGYLFLFGYNLLHFHSYSLNFNPNIVIEDKDDINPTNQHLTIPGFQCPVQNTYSSVHTSLLSNQNIDNSIITQVTFLKFNSEQFYFCNQYYYSNLLRAPPRIS
jgi:predicted N-acyltransferase